MTLPLFVLPPLCLVVFCIPVSPYTLESILHILIGSLFCKTVGTNVFILNIWRVNNFRWLAQLVGFKGAKAAIRIWIFTLPNNTNKQCDFFNTKFGFNVLFCVLIFSPWWFLAIVGPDRWMYTSILKIYFSRQIIYILFRFFV